MVDPKPGQEVEEMTWSYFDHLCRNLARQIKECKDFKYIYGVPRGGAIVAVRLSHLTGIKWSQSLTSKETLVVDDICDTGKTLGYLSNMTAVLVTRYSAKPKPNFTAETVGHDKYIIFPWEKD